MNTDLKQAQNLARKCKRILRMNVVCTPPRGSNITRRYIAIHEAAHCIATLALEGEVVLVHIGRTLGGQDLSYTSEDGLTGVVNLPMNAGIFALAGMLQNESDWIGVGDANHFLDYVKHQLGPWPGREPQKVSDIIRKQSGEAVNILRNHKRAIEPLADLIESGPQFNGIAVRDLVKKYSPSIPDACYSTRVAAKNWYKAFNGNEKCKHEVESYGLGQLIDLAIAEKKMQDDIKTATNHNSDYRSLGI